MKIIKSEKGFTLVELLLVMAIIGILAGIIFISIGPARKRAKVTAFKQSMRDIAIAATACSDADGKITGLTVDGESDICTGPGTSGDLGIGKVPVLKNCGGGTPVPSLAITTPAGIDFEISTNCPIATGISCYANCSVDGCKFSNKESTATSVAANDNDGCIQVK